MSTSGFGSLNSSATPTEIGSTVDEPDIEIDPETPAAAEMPSSANGDEPEAKSKPRRRTRTTKPKEEPAAAVEAPAPPPAPAEAPKRAGGLFSRLLGE